ncbi:Alpha carbonic anhydrase [Melia azedarach]|uniref:Alpha carbonic anhydrase n=1 Tax=Melia azedarach TaxID=155640 RepID=A0ACC1X1C4_MELAZ|nr:Alpha carbonic anhydrase [Melia azedarach]
MISGLPFTATLAVSLLFTFVSGAVDEGLNEVKYGYSGETAPDQWGNLTPIFGTCSSGKHQSPVNIIQNECAVNKTLAPLNMTYHSGNASMMSSGLVVGVHYEASVGDLIIDGKKYHFTQMHWHAPSEHLIDGERYAAELHLVHEADDQTYAVVAVIYQYGKPNSLINKFKKPLVKLGEEQCTGLGSLHKVPLGIFNTRRMKKPVHKYYRYVGSLTTPPCSESVTWSVLANVKTISKEQVEELKAPLCPGCKENARPVQELNGRRVELYSDEQGQQQLQQQQLEKKRRAAKRSRS